FCGALMMSSNPNVLNMLGTRFENVQFVDCCSGLDNDENPICESFGIITLDGACNVEGTGTIWNDDGQVTLGRGGGRLNDLHVKAHVNQIRDVIDLNPFAGHSPYTSPTRRCRYTADVYVGDGAGAGYCV